MIWLNFTESYGFKGVSSGLLESLEVASWAASGPEEFLGTHGKVAGGWMSQMSQMRQELLGRLRCGCV